MARYKVGLQNVGSYQVSGKPYATGSVHCRNDNTDIVQVNFPYVTSWVCVTNRDSAGTDLKVGFSRNGVLGTENNYYFSIPTGSAGQTLDLKLTQLFLSGSDNCSVVAGLTSIGAGNINNPHVSLTSPYQNWSGSAGVG